ncbi:Hypothetical predicted protein [Pelobates cultripes]|uniref:L1 transposable element RRM domain-containing protein n=1 Tax=Pelobates cultripes TaxID=61616 RepID=A0AAD1TMP2_PELCU|nr:Hypothetical predicted protein [Pelobates cultripes]
MEGTVKAHNMAADQVNRLAARVAEVELALEDTANRSRRNNLRLRGLPEREGEGPLQDMVLQILRLLLPDLPEEKWQLERVHRALHARSMVPNAPRDIIIKFLHFPMKEALMVQSRKSRIQYQGTDVPGFGGGRVQTLSPGGDPRSFLEALGVTPPRELPKTTDAYGVANGGRWTVRSPPEGKDPGLEELET